MKRVKLGGSDLDVSEICLGTMTFGNQTAEPEAHAQMDRALEVGLTFLDCAEMYPVNPVRAETVGRSEEIIGTWLKRSGHRDRVELATKITGPGQTVRRSETIDGRTVTACIEASLRRFQTDRIDLYQLHWPVRGSYAFRQNWRYDPSSQDRQATLDHMADVLGALDAAVRAGKVRAIGLSNESAWGLSRWVDVADRIGAPRMASIQNEYSLVHRLFDTDLAEVAVNEDVTLLSYSPLAAGMLTGKYTDGAVPDASRVQVDLAHNGPGNLGGRKTARGLLATDAYVELARANGWDIVHLAIGWQLTRPFKAIPIIGATTVAQLQHLIAGFGHIPDAALCKAIDKLNQEHALPY